MKGKLLHWRSRRLPFSSNTAVSVVVAPVTPPRPSTEEAKVVIENWRREYNTIRSYGSLNCRPPAPGAILPLGFQQPWLLQNSPEPGSTLT
jgi:hypothetical protein